VAPVEEFPDANGTDHRHQLSSNFYAIKAVLAGMKQRNRVRIVNVLVLYLCSD
jgi:hypothetical protein